jgi:prepilin-type N-terminal cleavage/methylation domain-containing protein
MFKCDQKNNLPKTTGFTLIELLMVISIIGLLSSVVLSSLSDARERSKEVKAITDVRQIIQAIIYAQGEMGQPLIKFAPPYKLWSMFVPYQCWPNPSNLCSSV